MPRRMDLTPVKERARRLGKAVFLDTLREKPEGTQKMLIAAGYSPVTARASANRSIMTEEVSAGIIDTEISVKDALAKRGVAGDFVADSIVDLMRDPNYKAKSNGIDFALKVGIGGGYAPTKSQNVDIKVTGTVKEFGKFKELTDDFEARLARMEMEESAQPSEDID